MLHFHVHVVDLDKVRDHLHHVRGHFNVIRFLFTHRVMLVTKVLVTIVNLMNLYVYNTLHRRVVSFSFVIHFFHHMDEKRAKRVSIRLYRSYHFSDWVYCFHVILSVLVYIETVAMCPNVREEGEFTSRDCSTVFLCIHVMTRRSDVTSVNDVHFD